MSKAFDTVNLHKLKLTNILNINIEFMANYIKERQPCAQYNITPQTNQHRDYHKVEFCLQHYCTFTFLTFHSLKKRTITTYADDITTTPSHTKHHKAQELIQPYLQKNFITLKLSLVSSILFQSKWKSKMRILFMTSGKTSVALLGSPEPL